MERNSNFCESRDETTKSGKILSHWFDVLLTKQRIKMRKESEKEREMESKSEWAVRPKKDIAFPYTAPSILRRHSSYFINFMCVFTSFGVLLTLCVYVIVGGVWTAQSCVCHMGLWFSIYTQIHIRSPSLIHPAVCFLVRIFFSPFIMCVEECVNVSLMLLFFFLLRFLFLSVFLFVSVFRFPFSRSPKSKNCCCRFVSYLILFCIVSYRKSTENMCV